MKLPSLKAIVNLSNQGFGLAKQCIILIDTPEVTCPHPDHRV